MNMTLFCDASFCPATRAAGWGAWAKRDNWDDGQFFGGGFKTEFLTSNDAELCAVANAMFSLSQGGHLLGLSALMIQSDCLRALSVIRGLLPGVEIRDHRDAASIPVVKSLSISQAEKSGAAVIRRVVEHHDLLLQLRHVRGHRSGPSRQWVNRQCDNLARQHMMAGRGAMRIGG